MPRSNTHLKPRLWLYSLRSEKGKGERERVTGQNEKGEGEGARQRRVSNGAAGKHWLVAAHSRAVSFAATRPVQVAAEKTWVHKHATEESKPKAAPQLTTPC